MLKVLISAYAVCPEKGSEPGMGWNWVIEISKHAFVHVITESEFKDQIEGSIKKLPQKNRLVFHYIDVGGDRIRSMCWNQGNWLFYHFYRNWQKQAQKFAQDLLKRERFDIVHQLNMIGFREPGYLWKLKDIKSIWGPIGGITKIPYGFLNTSRKVDAVKLLLKYYISKFQMMFFPRVISAFNNFDSVICSTPEVSREIFSIYGKMFDIESETGVRLCNRDFKMNNHSEPIRLLWVGRMINTKKLEIAIRTVAQVNRRITLEIIGDGSDAIKYKKLAQDLGVGDICTWRGWISNSEVQEEMRKCDLLFFPSVSDATSTVVLEALQNGLPVICHKMSGFGDVIQDKISGFTIAPQNDKQSVIAFSEILNNLLLDRSILPTLSENAYNRSNSYLWEKKGLKMVERYNKIVGKIDASMSKNL